MAAAKTTTRRAGRKAAPGGIVLSATVNVRAVNGKFPPGSYAVVLTPARASLVKDAERAFDSRADPVTGAKWPPRKTDPPNPPLVATGRLKAAAVAAATQAVVTGNTLTAKLAGPRAAVGGFHQRGTKLIAKRRFLGASIATVAVVKRGLAKEGVRLLRGGR